jgi:hypothetical protein
MRKMLVVGLIAINGVLAGLVVATPARTQIIPLGWFDCCQSISIRSSSEYCCRGCCWFVRDCRVDEDCDPPNLTL